MVWILQWCSDGDINCTLWSNSTDALMQACSEIEEDILSNWDLAEEFIHEAASEITNSINTGDYDKAVSLWNDFQCMYHDDCPQTYLIAERQLATIKPVLQNLILGEFTEADLEDEEDDDCPDTLPSLQTDGATCRGPCKQFNEYASADRMDGTYHCTQCKTFQGMFTP